MGERKRFRAPNVKPGELRMYWGKVDRWSSPDVVYHSGDGVHRADQRLLHWALGSDRMRMTFGEEREKLGLNFTYDPSFLQELEARGYDLKTLRFYIRKKEVPTPEGKR